MESSPKGLMVRSQVLAAAVAPLLFEGVATGESRTLDHILIAKELRGGRVKTNNNTI